MSDGQEAQRMAHLRQDLYVGKAIWICSNVVLNSTPRGIALSEISTMLKYRIAFCLTIVAGTCPSSIFSQNIYPVANYNASGSTVTAICSGTAGSKSLTSCTVAATGGSDFTAGQGVRIIGGGKPSMSAGFSTMPVVTEQNNTGQTSPPTGTHTYCYVVSVADPFGGISAAYPAPIYSLPASLPSNCVSKEPAATTFSVTSIANQLSLGGACPYVGQGAAFLWYVADLSIQNPSYSLFSIAGTPALSNCLYTPNVTDYGQSSTFGNRGGWPTTPLTQAKNEDFFTTLTAVNGSGGSTADALPQNFQGLTVAHDDTQAVQAAINAAVASNGGVVQFGNATYNIFRPDFLQNSPNYPTFGPTITNGPSNAPYTYLHIPNGSSGNIHIAGIGSYSSQGTTIINTPPDSGKWANFIAIGAYGAPCCFTGAPAYPSPSTFKIMPVAKGATQVTLTRSGLINI